MAILPNNFLTSAEGSNVSYDYYDVAEGTGVVKMYGYKTAANTYGLSRDVIYSDEIYSTGNNSASEILTFDYDFDLVLNMPKVLKGNLLVSAPVRLGGGLIGGGNIKHIYIIVKVRKWDGSTETEIANATSATMTLDAAGNYDHEYVLLTNVTVPSTSFKRGETIRVTLLGYAWYEAAAAGQWVLGHDPMNRTTTLLPSPPDMPTTTELVVHLPFKIDL